MLFLRPRTLAEIISSKLKVKYSCLNAYLSKANFTRGAENAVINLAIIQYFVTNKHGELLPRTDFRKSEEKTDLLTEEVGDLWDSQLGSVLRGLFSVESCGIATLPIFVLT